MDTNPTRLLSLRARKTPPREKLATGRLGQGGLARTPRIARRHLKPESGEDAPLWGQRISDVWPPHCDRKLLSPQATHFVVPGSCNPGATPVPQPLAFLNKAALKSLGNAPFCIFPIVLWKDSWQWGCWSKDGHTCSVGRHCPVPPTKFLFIICMATNSYCPPGEILPTWSVKNGFSMEFEF